MIVEHGGVQRLREEGAFDGAPGSRRHPPGEHGRGHRRGAALVGRGEGRPRADLHPDGRSGHPLQRPRRMPGARHARRTAAAVRHLPGPRHEDRAEPGPSASPSNHATPRRRETAGRPRNLRRHDARCVMEEIRQTGGRIAMVTTLKDALSALTVPGDLYEQLPDRRVRCYACGHRCLILDGRDGVCRVRFNRDGVLHVPHGYVATSLQLDPVEKKPFFHVLPGAAALSFGMLGCDYHCGYCQNWLTSQVLRDAEAVARPSRITPEEIVRCALQRGAPIITSTYNEPLITSEWAVAVFKLAKAEGLKTAYVSNGNATPEVLEYLRPWLDLYKVDLKGFNDANYRKLGGKLQTVLDTIQLLVAKGFW